MKKILFYCVLFCFFVSSCSCGKRKPRGKTELLKEINQTTVIKNNKAKGNSKNIIKQQRTNERLLSTDIFERCNSAVFTIYTSDDASVFQGSGFFISSDGLAVSNYHVFESTYMGLEEIRLFNGNTYKIKEVVTKDKEDDFIIFKVDIGELKNNYLPISNRAPHVGEKVYAIGSPLGLENTFTSGEISQLRGENNEIIQISVPIDHGSSGGALINEYGEVIGITTSGIDASGANLNFAININLIKEYLQ